MVLIIHYFPVNVNVWIGGRGRASSDRVNKIDQSSSGLGFRRGGAKVKDKKTGYYRPRRNSGKVMFLHLSVSHSVRGGGQRAWWGHMWRGDIHDRGNSHCSGRYASYWNAFLFDKILPTTAGKKDRNWTAMGYVPTASPPPRIWNAKLSFFIRMIRGGIALYEID